MALQKAVKVANSQGFKFLAAGDTIKGYYQGQVTKTINGSPAVEHTYKTAQGLLSVLGQANILTQIKSNGIEPGTYVEIVFSGKMMKLKNGRTMKVYDVASDRDNLDDSAEAPTDGSLEESEDEVLFEESDEVAPPQPVAPPRPASVPTPERKARMQALLNRGK